MTKYSDKKVQMEMIFLPFWAEKKSYSEKLFDYSGNLFDYFGKLVDYSVESVDYSRKLVDYSVESVDYSMESVEYSALSADCNKRNQLTAIKESADSSARAGRGALSPAEKIIKIILSYFIFAGVGEKKRGFNTLLIFYI